MGCCTPLATNCVLRKRSWQLADILRLGTLGNFTAPLTQAHVANPAQKVRHLIASYSSGFVRLARMQSLRPLRSSARRKHKATAIHSWRW